jgi:hypothetical protein
MRFARKHHDFSIFIVFGDTERVTSTVHHQHGGSRGGQFGGPGFFGVTGGMQREGESDDACRSGLPRRPARDPRAVAAAALDEGDISRFLP